MKTILDTHHELALFEKRAASSRTMIRGAIAVWLLVSLGAVFFASAEFFSRAGAIGVGLIVVAFSLSAAARQSYQTILLKGLIQVMREKNQIDAHMNGHDYDQNLEAVQRLLSRLDMRSRPARASEVAAAATATVQWGFGDLLIRSLPLIGA